MKLADLISISTIRLDKGIRRQAGHLMQHRQIFPRTGHAYKYRVPKQIAKSEIHFSASPSPSFKYGQKVEETAEGKVWLEGEKEGWKMIDSATEDPGKMYALMISAIVPRPVAFVSSISEKGQENLGLFSWFQTITHNPPLVMISVASNPTGLKDTAHNIKATKEFTINMISEAFVENANVCSINAPPEVSEWPFSGLTKLPSSKVKPPRVKESAFSMECELSEAKDIIHPVTGVITTTLIIAHVRLIHIRKDVLNERGNVDLEKFRPIARMGDITYATLGGAFRIPRPVWDQDSEDIQTILKQGA